MDQEKVKCCGTCRHWKEEGYVQKILMGWCTYKLPVDQIPTAWNNSIFLGPDQQGYSPISFNNGTNCPVHKFR